MAKTMTGGASAPAKRGRGRPPGSGKSQQEAKSGAAAETAPGLGHNQPTEGVFLAWVQRLRRHDEEVAKAAAALKVQRAIRKDLRKEAGSAGLVMGQLDEALEDLDKENADLAGAEERRRLYRQWLGLPVGGQTEAKLVHVSDPGYQRNLWLERANRAGRLGEDAPIDGCPPELIPDVQAAWAAGQTALMEGSKLLGAGFTGPDRPAATVADAQAAKAAQAPAEQPAPAPAPEPAPVAQGGALVLDAAAFPGETDIDECNLAKLDESKREAWAAADTVVVIMDGKKRVLKEEGYEDTGEPDVPLSEVETVEEMEAGPDWSAFSLNPAEWSDEQGAAVRAYMDALPVVKTDAGLAFRVVGTMPEHEGVRAAMRDRLNAMSKDAGIPLPPEPAVPAETVKEPDWSKFDDDPENWFAAQKAEVRAWAKANPDTVLPGHAGVAAFLEAVAKADRLAGGDTALDALREAEPELVEQVENDHGGDAAGEEFE